jgi:choline dehydrogenase
LFDGRKAVGIEYERMGITQKVYAEKEVILCAGSFNTPQLMQLSGVGPADHLRSLDVPVVANVPGVGSGLKDHSELSIQYECSQPVSIAPATTGFGRLQAGLIWLLVRRGAGASTQFEAGGFIRSRAGIQYPDLQLRFLPVAGYHNASHSPAGHGYQATVSLLRPTSKGQVRLHSLDPRAAPAILFNYGSTEEDRATMREGVRLTREILHQPAFAPFQGAQLTPGPEVESNADIDAFVRAKLGTSYHPSSTCRMGVDDRAVVSSEGFVYGVENLRVVDASILPSAISANLNATVIMMAERFADKILGKPQLPALDTPFHRSSDWERSQR